MTDVLGTHPDARIGIYFGNGAWSWQPLWDYCCAVAPEITRRGVVGHDGLGDGLDRHDSLALAEVLSAELVSGRTARYEAAYTALVAALPDLTCGICGGTCLLTDPGRREPRSCNACHGRGGHRPGAALYSFCAESVAEFRDFLAASSGFGIF